MKRWLPAVLCAALGVGLIVCGCLAAKDDKKGETFIDAAAAGPDFALQGEYAGEVGGDKYGAQVIARGDGKFELFLLKGGLPGDGWDGQTRIHADAKTDGDKTTFEGDGWSGTFNGSRLPGKSKEGEAVHPDPQGPREARRLGESLPPDSALIVCSTARTPTSGTAARSSKATCSTTASRAKRSSAAAPSTSSSAWPFMPKATEQARSNSGVYVQDRWEIQVLDSFGLTGEDNECGGIYHQYKPLVNMCYPPLSWQTYDVDFTAAQYDGDKKVEPAVITVKQNGVVIQDHVKLDKGPTGGGQPESAAPGPIQLQNHGNPVYFRNIWVVEK